MVKFLMLFDKPEDTVFTRTAQPTMNVGGQTIEVGPDFVTFSGAALFSVQDQGVLWQLTLNKDDEDETIL
jgi:hypothetical protein